MRWILIICLFVCYCDQQNDINRLKENQSSMQGEINRCQYDVDNLDAKTRYIENTINND